MISSHDETAINASDRSFGLDGAYDNYRDLSRSPSPYRRKRTPSRSPSPFRNRNPQSRAADRSPSPYRDSRAGNRSRSPNRRGRAEYSGSGSRGYKRKASPPRGRPDKRYHADNSKPSRHAYPYPPRGRHGKEHRVGIDGAHARRISYAEVQNPNPVPNFREGLSIESHRQSPHEQKQQTPSDSAKTSVAQASVSEDVQM